MSSVANSLNALIPSNASKAVSGGLDKVGDIVTGAKPVSADDFKQIIKDIAARNDAAEKAEAKKIVEANGENTESTTETASIDKDAIDAAAKAVQAAQQKSDEDTEKAAENASVPQSLEQLLLSLFQAQNPDVANDTELAGQVKALVDNLSPAKQEELKGQLQQLAAGKISVDQLLANFQSTDNTDALSGLLFKLQLDKQIAGGKSTGDAARLTLAGDGEQGVEAETAALPVRASAAAFAAQNIGQADSQASSQGGEKRDFTKGFEPSDDVLLAEPTAEAKIIDAEGNPQAVDGAEGVVATKLDGLGVTQNAGLVKGQTLISPASQSLFAQLKSADLKTGSQTLVFEVDPADLGKLEVRLKVNAAGQVQARIIVDQPATMQMLQNDSRGLERALQSAGINTDPSGLQFDMRGQGNGGQAFSQNSASHSGYKVQAPDLLAQELGGIGQGADDYSPLNAGYKFSNNGQISGVDIHI